MKTQTVERDVVSSGFQESRKATIRASAHAFNILSSGLYTDKIRAVLRELSTNAYDAHVEAGKADVPFYIKMPTNFDPTFRIRDYGVGLSHEDAMELYNTYFQSTKNDTNDAIGALGLGSKSPYSYTTAFSVVSYHNGMKRVYSSGLDEEGCPVCNFVYEEPTDEVNGLEVSFAVNKNDFREFNQKASLVLRRFNPLPNVVGYMEECYNPELPEVIVEGNGWRLTKSKTYIRDQIAIMGNIEYPIDCNALTGNNEDSEAYLDRDTARTFDRLNIELDFNIGDLEISASREGLGYTPQTSQKLTERINKVIEEIHEECKKKILQAKNYRDACRTYAEFGSEITMILSNSSNELKYNGKPVNSSIVLNFNHHIINVSKDDEEAEVIKRSGPPKIKHYYFKSTMRFDKQFRSENHDMRFSHSLRIPADEGCMIIVDDVQKKTTKRIVRWNLLNSEKYKQAYVISIPQEYPANKLLKSVLDYLDCNDEIYYISQMQDEPKEERTKRTERTKFTLYNYVGHELRAWSRNKVSHQWSKITNFDNFDPNETYYYIPVARYMAVRPGTGDATYDAEDMRTFTKWVEKVCNISPNNIYGIGKSHIKNIDQLAGTWINLYDTVKQSLEQYKKDKDFIERMSYANALRSFSPGFTIPTESQEIIDKVIQILGDPANDFQEYFQKISKVIKYGERTDVDKATEKLFQTLGVSPGFRDQEIVADIRNAENKIREKYELFWDLVEMTQRHYGDEKEDHINKIARYVKQMDELAACKGSETS